jgi:hypothetical protein
MVLKTWVASLVAVVVATGAAWAIGAETGNVATGKACPSGKVMAGQGCPYGQAATTKACPYGKGQLPPGHPELKTKAVKHRVRA